MKNYQVTHVNIQSNTEEKKIISFVINSKYHYFAELFLLENGKWIFESTIYHDANEEKKCFICKSDITDTPCTEFYFHKEKAENIFLQLKNHIFLKLKYLTLGMIFNEPFTAPREQNKLEKIERLLQISRERNDEIVAIRKDYEAYCPVSGVEFPKGELLNEVLKFSSPNKLKKESDYIKWIDLKGNMTETKLKKDEYSQNDDFIKSNCFQKKAEENKKKALEMIFYEENKKPKKTKHSIPAIHFIDWCIKENFKIGSFLKFVNVFDLDDIKDKSWYLLDDYREDIKLFAKDWIIKEERKRYLDYCKKNKSS